jgi:membrane-bound ClpP family serine protease
MSLALLAPWGPTEWAVVAAVAVILGIILLAAEILVIPGFGLTGILGVVCTIGGAALAWSRLGPLWGVLAIGVSTTTAGLLIWSFPRTRLGKKFLLHESHAGVRAPADDLGSLLGREGTAITMLRPSGTAEIGDRRVDVVTDGVFVDAGTRIRVARVEGARIVVEAREDDRPVVPD